MPYTSAQLQQYYSSLTGIPVASIDSATRLLFDAVSQQNANGAYSDPQALNFVINNPNVRSTFEVAVSAYQFFTGSAPTNAGIAYLRGDTGAGNANGLNSAYYQQFNEENRYYNFAINLASAGGAGNATFVANYGTLSFTATVTAAYETIVGSGTVGSAQAQAAIADIISRQAFFTQIAQQRAGGVDAGGAAGQNIALKAIVVGYILEEANKADVGTYARAIDQFEASTAAGNQISGANLLTTYTPGGAGFGTGIGGSGTIGGTQTNFNLTTGTDTPNNTTGNVQYVGLVDFTTAANSTLNPQDQIVATGANNTLTIDTSGAQPAGGNATNGALINGVQTINLRATNNPGGNVVLNAQTTPGATTYNAYLTQNTVQFNNIQTGGIAGIVGNGTVTNNGYNTFNYVAGATTAQLNLTSQSTNTGTGGVVGTVGGVFGTGAFITGNGLTTLNVQSSGAANAISALATGTGSAISTLNLVANQALTIGPTVNAIGANNSLATINVSGVAAVNIAQINDSVTGAGATGIATFTSTNTAGVTATFNARVAGGAAAAQTILTAAGAADNLTINGAFAGTSTVNLGGGTATTGDSITFTGTIGAGAQINGGGNATIGTTQAQFQQISGTAAAGNFTVAQRGNITGFSTVSITDALLNGATYDVNTIGAQNFRTIGVTTAGPTFNPATGLFSDGATLNAANNSIVTLVGSNGGAAAAGIQLNTGGLNVQLAGAATGTADVLNLVYANQGTSAAANNTTSQIATTGIETVNVTATRGATASATSQLTLSLSDAVLRNLTIAGNENIVFSTNVTQAAGPYQAYAQLQSVVSTSTGATNIDVSTINTTNGASQLTLTTGAGVDTLLVRDFTRITAGAGADLVRVAVTTNGNSYSSFLDATAGDRISFNNGVGNVVGVDNTTTTFTAAPAKIVLNPTATYQDYLDAATGTGVTLGQISAFDFGGNTFLVLNASAAVTYQNGVDSVIQLVGTHTLGTATAGVVTLAS